MARGSVESCSDVFVCFCRGRRRLLQATGIVGYECLAWYVGCNLCSLGVFGFGLAGYGRRCASSSWGRGVQSLEFSSGLKRSKGAPRKLLPRHVPYTHGPTSLDPKPLNPYTLKPLNP